VPRFILSGAPKYSKGLENPGLFIFLRCTLLPTFARHRRVVSDAPYRYYFLFLTQQNPTRNSKTGGFCVSLWIYKQQGAGCRQFIGTTSTRGPTLRASRLMLTVEMESQQVAAYVVSLNLAHPSARTRAKITRRDDQMFMTDRAKQLRRAGISRFLQQLTLK